MSSFARCASLLLILGSSCATTAEVPKNRPLYPGDAAGRASLTSLPSLDVDDSALTREMRIARLLSAESMSFPDPAKPASTHGEALQVWSDQVLTPWLKSKQRLASAARAELDRAAVQNHRQRIMAGALVGLVYEDVARVLMSVPIPDDLKAEPEIADMFTEVINSHALPYITQATRAYDACAKNAIDPKTMSHWTVFCEGREHRLPQMGADDGEKLGAGKTEVTVVAR